MPRFDDARALAETLLAAQAPERWLRAQHVTIRARELSGLPGVDRDPLMTAAILHGIGGSPVVARTGFAPFDAARFLDVRGYDERIVALVAHHAGAAERAARRGFAPGRHVDEATPTRDALWYCDATTGSDGGQVLPATDLASVLAAVSRTEALRSASRTL
ncbi:phosphohydrolase [Pseudonocardia sp. KRD291]|uniref:phosphohydrolase n=1 Tax=Pseudonocardia sp. KRD291 TaxID=2792007 RepID=UPI001C4A3C96|nr:phosphohydrolase [Pseudonocardia sp. KRD291]MBW0104047.1 phosphohydrolase [Pseudonocardia sp. KRD291]